MCPRRILHRAYFRWTILQPSDPAEAVSIYQYTCLFCNDIMTSTVKTGRVKHRCSGGCGRQFSFMFDIAGACAPIPHLRDDCTIFPEGQTWCLDGRLHCPTLPSETLPKIAPSPLAKSVQSCMSLKDRPGAWMAASTAQRCLLKRCQKLAPSPLAKSVQSCMSLKDGPGAWIAASTA